MHILLRLLIVGLGSTVLSTLLYDMLDNWRRF
jgi:hypothetical protein